MIDDELHFLSAFMENMALSEAKGAVQTAYNKKRPRIDGFLQKQNRSDQARDVANQSELFVLREALKSEKDSLQRLYRELEKERDASMTAANAAMAMIARLQEEKAAVLTEARRHKLAAEEREIYSQEAISMLKEALLFKEDELLALQELLNIYKEKVMQIEIEQQQYLEDRVPSEQLLLLTDFDAPLSSIDSKHCTLCDKYNQGYNIAVEHGTTGYDHEGAELQKGSELRYKKKYEETARQSWHNGEDSCEQGLENINYEQPLFQDSMHSSDYDPESKKQGDFWKQPVDDVSTSIFARLRRLEERFEHLRQHQTPEPQQLGFTCDSNVETLHGLDPQERVKFKSEAALKISQEAEPSYYMQSDRLDPVPEELSCGKVTLGIKSEAQEHGWSVLKDEAEVYELNAQQVHNERSAFFSVICDDESEGVHDVYEVQSEVKQSHPAVKGCLELDLEMRNRDASMHGMTHEAGIDPVKAGIAAHQKYEGNEACSAVPGKLSGDISPLDVKEVYANVLDDDVQQLKSRLQALEGERVFMKEAIDSLREENKELKILQELADQLRDLKIDVQRNEKRGQQGQPSVFNFLKGLCSFIGSQHPASNRGSRSLLQSCSFSTKGSQAGLHHILDEGSAIMDTPRVKREYKVKLNTT